MKYYNLKKKETIEFCDNSLILNFLYNNIVGRFFLKFLTTRIITCLYANYMNSPFSTWKIKKFIKKNSIKMSDYEKKNYKSFNDFFMRKLKKGKRKIDNGLISVCDSKLSIYEIDDNLILNIKNSSYSIDELIGDDSSKYNFKYALVFRLCVDDYHHYIFPDDGIVKYSKFIKGRLHTVRPIALKKVKVFSENTRCVSLLECKNLGIVGYIEVGAMMVGKIVNEKVNTFNKADEKGHFEFGGSTIIMLLQDSVTPNELIVNNTNLGIETIVKLGERLD